MARQINEAGLDLVKRNEGLRLTSYQDVAGIWTIGYGHTPAQPDTTITEEQATSLLIGDLGLAEGTVDAATADVATGDNQFAAMVSLAFNIGGNAYRSSTVLRLHRAGDYAGAADAFLMWDKSRVGGQLTTVPGLLRRRQEERTLYLAATA